jgi:uncharacterized protein (UPF0333 family)
MLKRIKGQSTLEYAMIIAVVVGALIAIQIYMKRGVQGKLREATDETGGQYSAGNVTSKFTTEQIGTLTTTDEFGTAVLGQGGSEHKITKAAETDTTATGPDAEKIAKTLKSELDTEGLLPKD